MTSQTISRQAAKTPQRSAPTAITAAQVETLENALTECGKAFQALSELCLAIEYSLHDPDLTAERNEELRIDIDNARADGQLEQREVDHLLSIVARNADSLTEGRS